MSTISSLLGRVPQMKEHPGWLFNSLINAEVANDPGTNRFWITAHIGMRAQDAHHFFSRLRPSLILADGSEIPLEGIEHTKNGGFPLRCLARSAKPLSPQMRDARQVTHVRIRLGRRTKDIRNIRFTGT